MLKKARRRTLAKRLDILAKKHRKKSDEASQIRLKKLAAIRRKIYKEQISQKKDFLQKKAKRQFSNSIHVYEDDPSIREKAMSEKEISSQDTNENDAENSARMPGQLFRQKKACKNCGKKFNTYEELFDHIEMKRVRMKRRQVPRSSYVPKIGSYYLICKWPDCCYNTHSLENFNEHMRKKHDDVSRTKMLTVYAPYGTENNADDLHVCDRCNLILSQHKHLLRHKETCVGKKFIICDICGDEFRDSVSYIEHVADVHKPPSSFVELNSFKEGSDPSTNPEIVGQRLADDVLEARLARTKTRFKTYARFYATLTNLDEVLNDENLADITEILKHEKRVNGTIKFFLSAVVILSRVKDDGDKEFRFSRLRSSKDFEIGTSSTIKMTVEDHVTISFENLWMVAEHLGEQGSGMIKK